MTHTLYMYIGAVITRCTGQMSAAVGERGCVKSMPGTRLEINLISADDTTRRAVSAFPSRRIPLFIR